MIYMGTAILYKNPLDTDAVLTEEGAPFPDGGLTVARSEYYDALTLDGRLLTYLVDNGNSTAPLTGTVTVSADLVITVDLGGELGVEVAYVDGAFTSRYSASTLNTETGAYSLVRAGGWPTGATVVVVEPPVIPTGGQTWGAIYHYDFTSLPTQIDMGPGSHVIDGKTWWLKGSKNGAVHSAGILNGQGLYMTTSFFAEGGGTPGFRWFLPLSQVSGYNPSANIAVYGRVGGTATAGSCMVGIGLAQGGADGTDVVSNTINPRVALGEISGDDPLTSCQMFHSGGGSYSTLSTRSGTGSFVHGGGAGGLISGVTRVNEREWRGLAFPYSGGVWEAKDPVLGGDVLWSTSTPGYAQKIPSTEINQSSPMGVWMAINYGGGGSATAYLKELWIVQPKVA